MKYRTKLVLAFLALAVATSALLYSGSARASKRAITEQIRSAVLSIAITAADAVDGELHERIRTEADMSTPAYREIERDLRRVRDANRRDDLHVAFIYTMRKVSGSPDVWAYVVDAEEDGEDKSATGEEMTWEDQYTEEDEPLVLGAAYAEREFTRDEYGYWLSANAPVRDAAGEPVAMLGVDISADHVIAQQRALARAGLVALGVAIVAGAFLSLLLARWAARPLAVISGVVRKIGDGHLEARVEGSPKGEFGELAEAVNAMARSLQERDALKGALSRTVSNEVAERLVKEGEGAMLEGERRVVTVLASRVGNLTQLASALEPGRLLQLLNAYFEAMVEIVFRHGGTIDRLLGNRLIAVFGAPLDDPEQERNAVEAAIAMSEEIDRLNEGWGLGIDERFEVGLGIHTGEAIIGNVGANQKIEFTVIGESVQIATMIEELAAEHRSRGLVSHRTVEATRGAFRFREVGDIEPAGAGGLLRLYTTSELRRPA